MERSLETRVRELFAEAMERPPRDRPAFLRAACNGRQELLAEILALVEASDRAGDCLFMAGPTVGPFSSDMPLRSPVRGAALPAAEQPGDMVGRYRLLQLIGEGGFGSVFRAEQQHPVRRQVAIKVTKLG